MATSATAPEPEPEPALDRDELPEPTCGTHHICGDPACGCCRPKTGTATYVRAPRAAFRDDAEYFGNAFSWGT